MPAVDRLTVIAAASVVVTRSHPEPLTIIISASGPDDELAFLVFIDAAATGLGCRVGEAAGIGDRNERTQVRFSHQPDEGSALANNTNRPYRHGMRETFLILHGIEN